MWVGLVTSCSNLSRIRNLKLGRVFQKICKGACHTSDKCYTAFITEPLIGLSLTSYSLGDNDNTIQIKSMVVLCDSLQIVSCSSVDLASFNVNSVYNKCIKYLLRSFCSVKQ